MLLDSRSNVFTKADVKFGIKISQNVNAINSRHPKRKLVAEARFELAIPPLRDYELTAREIPVMR
jgi:hypothetical protein